MFKQPNGIEIVQPQWIEAFSQSYVATTDLSKRMAFVIAAARQNIVEKTGGPFAAAVFESASGTLVSLAVNVVTTQRLSILHAEMVAITIAQKKLDTYDLGGKELPSHDLFASTEPCAMCFGAIPWSGVRRVVTGAQDSDARKIGFDEGPKPGDWAASLRERGIEVMTDVERQQAADVLDFYLASHGHIYNSREA